MKRGSALLVVLGMMAFIVVSAVAFSAYMRFSRMPSSYLRRTSSSRLLVKAALAEAIDAVDAAIGNNPYPGVGAVPARGVYRNVWQDRVFTGTNALAGVDSTVSTLSMEGLAYIPPAFVNEVRYYSRRTPTAAWKTLNYDAGRFAFCVVDVSDCLDVNRVIAGSARSSAADGRITLAHCFENPSHTGYTMDPEAWDDFMKNYDDGTASKLPLVSVADMNLAIGQQKPGGLDVLSPFCKYLRQSNNAKFVTNNSDGDKDVELQRNLAFVTDSLFATTNRASDAIDLARASDQPFAGLSICDSDDEKKNDDTVAQLFRLKSRFLTKYGAHIQRPERIQLYDYLDRDSVPLSLAMPTVERTPMVTGARLAGRVALNLGELRSKEIEIPGNTASKLLVKARDLELNIAALKAQASFVYPFKYSRGSVQKYRAQAAATITFVKEGSERSLRLETPKYPAIFAYENWTKSQKSPTAEKYGSEEAPVVVTMQSAPVDLEDLGSKKILQEQDALLNTADFDFGNAEVKFVGPVKKEGLLANVALPDEVGNTTFLTAQKMTKDPTTGTYAPEGDPAFFTSFRPSTPGLDAVVDKAESGARYVPVIQLWVRILDANNEIVDLVPACYKDDEEESTDLARIASCTERPLLRFFASKDSGGNAPAVEIDSKMMNFEGATFDIYPRAYLADDPRFNYAPENMLACMDDSISGDFKTAWFGVQRSASRDGDIFMMTSDAGYLQSIYELVALVDCCGMDGTPDMSAVDSTAFDGTLRTEIGKLAGGDAMWRTYSQFRTADEAGGDITRNFDVANGDRGFRVNPYTRDPNIMMAALVNTPLDWWAASTNFLNDANKKTMAGKPVRGRVNTIDLDAAAPFTFSEHSGAQVKFRYGTRKNPEGTLMQVAQNLIGQFASAGNAWQAKFDQQSNWNSDTGVVGVDLGVDLHSVDKKFLHGFWRECFANRQHLFLIFVRAEPMMMGGGGQGHTPPQLGARAVALVWRDPTPNVKYPNGPHRTRVLFYRQFD